MNGFIFVLLTRDIRKRLCSCACLRQNTASINSRSWLKSVSYKSGSYSSPNLPGSKKPGVSFPIARGKPRKSQPDVPESPSVYTPVSSYDEY